MIRAILGFMAIFVSLAGVASDDESSATDAALEWLDLVDSGRYEMSWDTAASLFRQQVNSSEWSRAVAAARRPLGALKSRAVISATYTETLPGAPKGRYVVVQFLAEFENHTAAVETATPMWDDGSWRVSGYYVK